MANRHERRKTAKLMRVEMMDVNTLRTMGSICAWDGCTATANDPDDEGWSKMILYTGPTKVEFLEIDPQRMARDCVLCPKHSRQLDETLLRDIGGRLRHVEGNA